MEAVYPLLLCGATSVLVFIAGRRRAATPLREAAARALEWMGLTAGFVLLNVVVGMGAVLALRRLTGAFVSLYLNVDVTIVALSAAQAVVAQWWWGEKKDGAPPKSP